MPDFVPVLIVAVLLLIVLLVVFGGSIFFVPGGAGGKAVSSRTVVLGQDFVVKYSEGQSNITSFGWEVSQGLFGNSDKKIEFAVDNYRDASEGVLKLKTWNSNYYGNFIIKINDQDIYRGVPDIGDRTIVFDGSVFKASNSIEVEAESSGWKIWAPTVYIFDASLSVNYIGRITQNFSFSLNEREIANVDRARLLIFGTRKGIGDLHVKVNGREIFSGITTVYTDFGIDSLKVGNNFVELTTETDTMYNISSAQIVLFF